jgi:hypothetical protein
MIGYNAKTRQKLYHQLDTLRNRKVKNRTSSKSMSSLLSVTVVTNRDSNMAVLSDITKDNTCNNLKKKGMIIMIMSKMLVVRGKA